MNIRRVLQGAMIACLMCIAAVTRAAIVSGLYQAGVPVPDQSAAARRVALQQALAAVLVKVTGERSAGGVPALASLLQDPSQFLQEYHYGQTQAGGTAPVLTYYDLTRTGAPAIAPTGLMLWARFDPDAINHAVRAAHEPLWGQERPATLVWLAVQNGAGYTILNAADSSAVMQSLNSAAGQRGVPLTFPLMDARDQQAIGVPDILNNITAAITQASQRYRPGATLVGSIYSPTPGQYAARWQLTVAGASQTWTTQPGDLASVAADGVQTLADNYARRFAIAADATGLNGVAVEVDGVSSVDIYAKVLAYLTGLTPVRNVQVTRVENGAVFFSLDSRGDLDNLQQAIVQGGLLTAATSAAPAAVTLAAPLRFNYVP